MVENHNVCQEIKDLEMKVVDLKKGLGEQRHKVALLDQKTSGIQVRADVVFDRMNCMLAEVGVENEKRAKEMEAKVFQNYQEVMKVRELVDGLTSSKKGFVR